MKLDITKGIQRKGVDVPFSLSDVWGEDHWNGDTIAYVQPVSFSGTYMLADETVLVRGEARAVIQSPCARCLTPTETTVTAEVTRLSCATRATAKPSRTRISTHTRAMCLSLMMQYELPSCLNCPHASSARRTAQCGANLNVNVCSCQKDLTSRNPFSALASLLNEDEEV